VIDNIRHILDLHYLLLVASSPAPRDALRKAHAAPDPRSAQGRPSALVPGARGGLQGRGRQRGRGQALALEAPLQVSVY